VIWQAVLLAGVAIWLPQEQRAQKIDQSSSGPCSPNIAGVQGNVEINVVCPPLPDNLMKVFNRLYDEQQRHIKGQEQQNSWPTRPNSESYAKTGRS